MRMLLRDVAIGYSPDEPKQKYINFSVGQGEICCVLGPNGCGKTTLVKTILGMLPPLAGSITMDGDDMTKWKASRLSDVVAYVAQAHERPFPFKVKDVVMLGRISRVKGMGGQPTADDVNIVENAMNDMGIWHLRDAPYVDISGGELQLVMFARALAQEPKMLIMDEPTAALDYGNAMRVISKVRELARLGYAVVMITHSPDHAFMVDANVAMFMRSEPMRFGPAVQVITRENIKEAYGVDVRIVDFPPVNGHVLRLCAPEFPEELSNAGQAAAPGVQTAQGNDRQMNYQQGVYPQVDADQAAYAQQSQFASERAKAATQVQVGYVSQSVSYAGEQQPIYQQYSQPYQQPQQSYQQPNYAGAYQQSYSPHTTEVFPPVQNGVFPGAAPPQGQAVAYGTSIQQPPPGQIPGYIDPAAYEQLYW